MMSHQQQMAPSRASVNGFPHRKLDREGSGRHESKIHLVNSSYGGFSSAENGGKLGHASHSRDRLIYVLTQLIGHPVDVHVKNGSVFSGIFHATNSDKDFGVVLKMAQVIKDSSVKGQRYAVDVVKKPETMIIPARELVQILAKDVALGGDELPKGPGHDKRKDLLIDSAISCTHYPEERELERWAPDEGDSECLELEKYDRKGNRSWDQFETNAALFGVKSTFNEELYTTKLERGPHMRELERHASRIAREIEGEDTKDIHLAEERGLYLGDDLDHDEEIKYSAVCRDTDNSKYKSVANVPSSTHHVNSLTNSANIDPNDSLACSSTMDEESSSYIFVDAVPSATIQTNDVSQETSDYESNKPLSIDKSRLDKKLNKDSNDDKDNRNLQPENTLSGVRPLISEDLDEAPSSSGQGFISSVVTSDLTVSGKHPSALEPVNSSQRPGNSTSSTSERIVANSVASAPGLSPSSSMGSLTSEKSTLNPNAKEFKLNPNAKSFTPSVSLRPPHSPASDGSYYYPNNMPTAPLGPGLPVGMGFPPAYGGQPIMYNAQPGTSPQGYMHPAGSQEMQQYRGRNF
ncbi:polyadenylate-binding protein-interacting protein 4-like isoform X2 [Phragmites australis]|uniref:polyadenylate-binding protein-interacting protein 4-like isoform X2 n=1 Tax=Phragmites australis TaxID=29695 RepID=UPI002D79B627|nr:polyadenylate-binding protein-interacting protein 4-like isoform X2 [Phragmites australis]